MRSVYIGLALGISLSAFGAQAQTPAQKYTWDGLGKGRESKCSIYRMHIELTAENGRVVGTFQQKDRPLRRFDLPTAADGSFSGQVAVSGGTMRVQGQLGASPEIKLTGYCDFGGALKSA